MLDCSDLAALVSQAMEELDETYDDETSSIRTIALVIELDRGDHTTLFIRSTEDRRWALEAFLGTAADWMHEQTPRPCESDE